MSGYATLNGIQAAPGIEWSVGDESDCRRRRYRRPNHCADAAGPAGIDCELFEQADSIREAWRRPSIRCRMPSANLQASVCWTASMTVAIRTAELFYLTRHGQQVWHEKARARCRP